VTEPGLLVWTMTAIHDPHHISCNCVEIVEARVDTTNCMAALGTEPPSCLATVSIDR